MTDLPTPDDTIDIGLRDRLATLAPPAPLDLATLDRLEAEVRAGAARARRRQHRRVGLAVGTVAAAAALLVAVLVWPGSNGQRVTVGPPSTPVAPPGPGRLLMASADGRLEELSPTTGQVLRTFSGTGQPGRIVTSLSTDGAGRYAYVSWRTQVTVSAATSGIDRVSLPDGAVSTVTGVAPSDLVAISPDGRRLASAPAHALGRYVVTVVDLRTDRSETWYGPPPTGTADLAGVTALSWSHDGRSVAVSHQSSSTTIGVVSDEGVDLIDTSRPQSRTNPRSLSTDSTAWTSNATYLGRNDHMAVLVGCSPEDTCLIGPSVVAFDLATGRREPLARSETQLVRAEPIQLASDSRGTLYLLVPETSATCQGGLGYGGSGEWSIERLTARQAKTMASGSFGPVDNTPTGGPQSAPAFIAWIP